LKKNAARARSAPPTPAQPRGKPKLSGLLRSLQPEWVYLILALGFGSALLVLTPPCQVPDEEAHFRRAYEISEGHVIALKEGDYTGDYLPRSLKIFIDRFQPLGVPQRKTSASEIQEAGSVRLEPNDREFAGFSNAAVHSPLIYLPQAAGILLARQVSSSVLVLFYAGRILNLLAAVGVTFLAIRIAPIARWGFVALALTPMTLALMASLSSDALTNSLAFLLIAQVLACAVGPDERLSARSVAQMALASAALGLVKQAYFLLPLCYLLIPLRKFRSAWRYLAGFALVNGATFLAAAGWSLVVRDIYSPADMRFGMNPREQINLMFSEPSTFFLAVVETAKHAEFLCEEYLGWLGLVDLRLPLALYIVEFAFLAAVFLGDKETRVSLSLGQACVAAAVASLVSLTVLVVIHITWDAVGAKAISIQGRYFIPIGPLVGIALGRMSSLAPSALQKMTSAVPVLASVTIPIILATAVVRVHDRYFVDTPKSAAERISARGEALFQEGGQEERARPYFVEALRLDPDNTTAHLYIGILLKSARPREAAEHLRAVLAINPEDVPALHNLALILAQQGELPEAIRLYREALRIKPDPIIQESLDRALSARDALLAKMRQIPLAVEALMARAGMLEPRHVGEAEAGQYLRPMRGPVVDADGRPLFRVELLWRSPPPCGEEIRVFDTNGMAIADGRRVSFYACAAKPIGANRIFVFPPPVGVAILTDEEVSWFFQVPLAELTADERERENAYRVQLRLRFPLETLPE
jgi:uncharacterized membrane protein